MDRFRKETNAKKKKEWTKWIGDRQEANRSSMVLIGTSMYRMDVGTYPINHSTVSRRYSGSRSSLAVLFDLSNYEIVIVAKSIRCWCCFGCCCYLLSLSIVLFLFSPLSSEHCFEMMRLCMCVCLVCLRGSVLCSNRMPFSPGHSMHTICYTIC